MKLYNVETGRPVDCDKEQAKIMLATEMFSKTPLETVDPASEEDESKEKDEPKALTKAEKIAAKKAKKD